MGVSVKELSQFWPWQALIYVISICFGPTSQSNTQHPTQRSVENILDSIVRSVSRSVYSTASHLVSKEHD